MATTIIEPKRPSRRLRAVRGDDEQPAWRASLAQTAEGRIRKTFGNVCKILRNEPAWNVHYCEMRLSPILGGRPITDADTGRMREQLFEGKWSLEVGKDMLRDAIVTVAHERSAHPVREYLRGLVWDRKPYLGRVAHHVLGIPAPSDLTQAMIARWAVSAVARVMRPGCKVDTALVLVGKQAAKKSTFFRVLGGDWFSDSPMDLGNKDAVMQLYAAWIYEWGEIDKVTSGNRYTASDTKAFLSQSTDTIRLPYAGSVTVQPRHSVIVGSTNVPDYLNDETGSRRFWTVPVPGDIDIALLRTWRDQIWAEAVALYDGGEQWWLTPDEEAMRADTAEDFATDDPWKEHVTRWLENRPPGDFAMSDLLEHAVGLKKGEHTVPAARRAGALLRGLGWRRTREGGTGRKLWRRVL